MVTETKLTNAHAGCWFDGARGIYIGEAIQEEAVARGGGAGVPLDHAYCSGRHPSSSWYHEEIDHGAYHDESVEEAIEFLNALRHHDDYSFDFSEGGDFGYYHHCNDDEKTTTCEFC